MSTSIGLDSSGDIYVDATGNIGIVSDLKACIQDCQTAMKAQQGEMIYNMTGGIPYRAIVWDNYRPPLFEAAARGVLLGVPGVQSVQSFSQAVVDNQLQYTAVIQTIYGVAEVSG